MVLGSAVSGTSILAVQKGNCMVPREPNSSTRRVHRKSHRHARPINLQSYVLPLRIALWR